MRAGVLDLAGLKGLQRSDVENVGDGFLTRDEATLAVKEGFSGSPGPIMTETQICDRVGFFVRRGRQKPSRGIWPAYWRAGHPNKSRRLCCSRLLRVKCPTAQTWING